jgi:hypothetical protein
MYEYIFKNYGPFIYERVEFGNYAVEYDTRCNYYIGISFMSQDEVSDLITFKSKDMYIVSDYCAWSNSAVNTIGYVFDLNNSVLKFGEVSYFNRWVFVPADVVWFISYYAFPNFAVDYYEDNLSIKVWQDYLDFTEEPKRQGIEYPLHVNNPIDNLDDAPVADEYGERIPKATK